MTIKDFHVTTYISWDELHRVMKTRMYTKFLKWMDGQTCAQEGAYPDDVERFLKGLPVID